MRLELITAPTAEPVTIAQAKVNLRAPAVADEDALLERLIRAARRMVEQTLRRKLVTQSWRLYFDAFPGQAPTGFWPWLGNSYTPPDTRFFRGSELVMQQIAPLASVDAVKYIDINGALQTLATSVYQAIKEEPPRLVLAYGQSWPSLRGDRESVRVEVTCGYGKANAVPEDITSAMHLLIAHWYENREAVIVDNRIAAVEVPAGWDALLAPYIVAEF